MYFFMLTNCEHRVSLWCCWVGISILTSWPLHTCLFWVVRPWFIQQYVILIIVSDMCHSVPAVGIKQNKRVVCRETTVLCWNWWNVCFTCLGVAKSGLPRSQSESATGFTGGSRRHGRSREEQRRHTISNGVDYGMVGILFCFLSFLF